MKEKFIASGETKITSRHQITIPKPIWEKLNLKAGSRLDVHLSKEGQILVEPKSTELELTEEEWNKLCMLAKGKANKGKEFSDAKKAKAYLRKL